MVWEPRLPVLSASLPWGCGGLSFLLSQGWRPRSAVEDHCQGRHELGSPVFLPQTFVVAGSPYLMGMLTLQPD